MTDRDLSWLSRSWLEFLRDNGVTIDYPTMMQIWEVFDDRLDWLPYLIAASGTDPAETIKWIVGPLAAVANDRDVLPDKVLAPDRLRSFVEHLIGDKFPRHFAKPIFDELIAGFDITTIIAQSKYQEAGDDELDQVIDTVIAANPDQAVAARENPKLVQWFVGQVLKHHKGLSPPKVIELLTTKLVREYDERTT